MSLPNKIRFLLKSLGLYTGLDLLLITAALLRHRFSGAPFSQSGEDSFVAAFFNNKQSGTYVEIGANNPVILNSTYLLYRAGWSGLVVDPIRRFQSLFRLCRPRDRFINAAAGIRHDGMTFHEMIPDVFSTFDAGQVEALRTAGAILWKSYAVPVRSLEQIFREYGAQTVDFLGVDAEGHDLEVLESNDWSRHRPRLVCCETDKAKDLDSFFLGIRYEKIAIVGCNAFYKDTIPPDSA